MGFILSFLLLFMGVNDDPVYHIFRPHRLLLLDPHKTVRGVIDYVNTEFDGDCHIRLRVDDKTLLTKCNIANENGCLILEIVCLTKGFHCACKGYRNTIPIPSVGDSVEVIGFYVYDKIHKINEIHPVERLRILKR